MIRLTWLVYLTPVCLLYKDQELQVDADGDVDMSPAPAAAAGKTKAGKVSSAASKKAVSKSNGMLIFFRCLPVVGCYLTHYTLQAPPHLPQQRQQQRQGPLQASLCSRRSRQAWLRELRQQAKLSPRERVNHPRRSDFIDCTRLCVNTASRSTVIVYLFKHDWPSS